MGGVLTVVTGYRPFAFETPAKAVLLTGEVGCDLSAVNMRLLSPACPDFIQLATAFDVDNRPSASELLMHPFVLKHRQ